MLNKEGQSIFRCAAAAHVIRLHRLQAVEIVWRLPQISQQGSTVHHKSDLGSNVEMPDVKT